MFNLFKKKSIEQRISNASHLFIGCFSNNTLLNGYASELTNKTDAAK